MPMIAVPALVIGSTTVVSAAVASAIVTGIVYGAVVGAVTSAISGGNILEGALKGAFIGGITGGVMGAIGGASGAASNVAAGQASTNTATTAALQGPDAALFSGLASPTTNMAAGATNAAALTGAEAGLVPKSIPLSTASPANLATKAATNVATTTNLPAADANVASGAKATERGFFDKLLFDDAGSLTDEAGKMISGGVKGLAEAALTEKPETQSEFLRNTQALNIAGKYNAQVANIQIPDAWKRLNTVPTVGVQNQAATKPIASQALTAQQQAALQKQPGASYAT